jgi:tRNA-2-methylthio-N6-dimethylallyladenosine synthase
MPGRYYIKTFGCQMNEYDSTRMGDVLEAGSGFTPTDDPAEADVLLMNTCSVREKAEDKVYSLLGEWRGLKKLKPHVLIGVGGCVASQEGESITKRAPYVDLVFGPQTLHRLPDMIGELKRTAAPWSTCRSPKSRSSTTCRRRAPKDRAPTCRSWKAAASTARSAWCRTRAATKCRGSFDSVMDEVRSLASQGVGEITLLGQNVNAFAGPMADGTVVDLATLIHYVAEVDGVQRIRFTTSHPVEFGDSLIEAYANVPKLANQLHLAVQSGSDRILSAMKRGYTALEFKEKLRRLRAVRPTISVSTDIIVGFPGETDRDFEATLKLVREANFDQSYSFIYSQRPGTPAASLPDDVSLRSEAAATRAAAGAAESAGARHQRADGRHDADRARRAPVEKGFRGTRRTYRERSLGELRGSVESHRSFRRRGRRRSAAPSRCAGVSCAPRQRGTGRPATPGRELMATPAPIEPVREFDLVPPGQHAARETSAARSTRTCASSKDRMAVSVKRRGANFRIAGARAHAAEDVVRDLFEATRNEDVSLERVHLALRDSRDMPGALGPRRTRGQRVGARHARHHSCARPQSEGLPHQHPCEGSVLRHRPLRVRARPISPSPAPSKRCRPTRSAASSS